MNETMVTLKKGEGRYVRSGGLWIFDNEIDTIKGRFHNGEVVSVQDFKGAPVGRGYINQNSKIRIRLLTRDIHQDIDDAFLRQRLEDAWQYRKSVIDTSSCRIVFGDADFLPGLVIDKFEDVLVIQSLSLGMDKLKERIVALMKDVLAQDGITVRGVYERSDAKERLKEGLERIKGFTGEAFDTNVTITENGVKYALDIENGQKTGFFLDQKLNRQAVQHIAKDKDVLDCFTYMGSFALNAGIAGAKSVLGVDASDLAVHLAQDNAKLNHLEERVHFVCDDVFDFLPRQIEEGRTYDVVILDPPAFTKSRASVKNATKGYREINRQGMKLVKDGGFLCTCTCSHFMDNETFVKAIEQAAKSAGVRLRQYLFLPQAPDHPILRGASESLYLKFYIFQILREK